MYHPIIATDTDTSDVPTSDALIAGVPLQHPTPIRRTPMMYRSDTSPVNPVSRIYPCRATDNVKVKVKVKVRVGPQGIQKPRKGRKCRKPRK